MANCYWVGGTGNWTLSDPTNWSATSGGAGGSLSSSVPVAGDNIIFDANSGPGNYTVTFDGTWNFTTGNVTMSNPSGGVMTFAGTYSNFFIGGNLTMASGVVTSGLVPNFYNTVPVTATTNSVFMTYFVVNGTSTVNLGSALNVSNLTVYTGALDTNNYNVTANVFYFGTVSGTASLNFGSSTITCAGGGTSAWQVAPAGGTVNLTAGTSIINFTNAGVPYPSFVGGGKSYATVNIGGQGLKISNDNTFDTLSNSVTPAHLSMGWNNTQTVTNFNINGTSATSSGWAFVNGSAPGGPAATISKASGTVSCDYLYIQDVAATGGATWYAGANSINVSDNSGWIFSAAPVPAVTTGNFFQMFGM